MQNLDSEYNNPDLLKEVLETSYTVTHRFNAVSGIIHCWTDVDSNRNEYLGDFVIERSPDGSLLDGCVDPGADVQDPERQPGYPGSSTLGLYEMLNPWVVLSYMTFSGFAVATKASRPAIRVMARRRRQEYDRDQQNIWEDVEEFELYVDRERGILLSAIAYYRGQPISGKEIMDITFDGSSLTEAEDWSDIGTLVNLVYSAQTNFESVSAEVTEWHWRRRRGWGRKPQLFEYGYRLWVVNPDRFRMDRVGDRGDVGLSRIYDGETWWSFSHNTNRGVCNVPAQELPVWVEKVPAGEMGPAMYEDTEYAIVERKELNPSWLISGAWFEVLGYGEVAGRSTLEVRATPREHNQWTIHWWRGIDQMDLSIDAERGLLLKLDAVDRGQKVSGHEVFKIDFDIPIPSDIFRFRPPAGSIIGVRS